MFECQVLLLPITLKGPSIRAQKPAVKCLRAPAAKLSTEDGGGFQNYPVLGHRLGYVVFGSFGISVFQNPLISLKNKFFHRDNGVSKLRYSKHAEQTTTRK